MKNLMIEIGSMLMNLALVAGIIFVVGVNYV
jgi:hypothetical protein